MTQENHKGYESCKRHNIESTIIFLGSILNIIFRYLLIYITIVRETEVEDALQSNNSIEDLEQSIIDQVHPKASRSKIPMNLSVYDEGSVTKVKTTRGSFLFFVCLSSIQFSLSRVMSILNHFISHLFFSSVQLSHLLRNLST